MTIETLIRPDGTALHYERFIPPTHGGVVDAGGSPQAAQLRQNQTGVMFMHGFQSDMNATKALYLADACRRHGIPFIRYDAFAHGRDTNKWEDFTIGRAVHDALLVLDELTHGPQIVVGSSMGGWVALRLLEERPERIAGMVGIATAPDFTRKIPAPHDRYTQALLDEGPNQFVMDEDWTFTQPVHLLQGKLDDSVPWETVNRVAEKFPDPSKVRITLIEGGIHNLNRPEDLEWQEKAILDVLSRI